MTLCTINSYLPPCVDQELDRVMMRGQDNGEMQAIRICRQRSLSFSAPFYEGVLHLKEGVLSRRPDEQSPSPKERVLHVAAGILLLIPIINRLVFIILSGLNPVNKTLSCNMRFKSVCGPNFAILEQSPCSSEKGAVEWAMAHKSREITDQFDAWFKEGQAQGYLKHRFACWKGQTILSRIAFDTFEAYIPQIIAAGVNLSAQDESDFCGNTALHWAIANAQNRAALQIITSGGEGSYLNVQCYKGNTPLHLVIAKGYVDRSAHNEALTVSNFELTQKLLEHGADPNLKNHLGNTPLHLAFLRRDVPTIQALLAKGADSTLCNNNGKTALDLLELDYYDAIAILTETVTPFLLNKREREANRLNARNLIS